MEANEVINFWFEEVSPKSWWAKDKSFDLLVREKFFEVHWASHKGELWHWRRDPQGYLAEIIVLDQFSRNMFRDRPEAFASDSLALFLAQECISRGFDQKIDLGKRAFIYMPFMHSESSLIHEQAVELFSQPGLESNLDFELRHKSIIDRFGRYPHRNAVLGRESTSEELKFLAEGTYF